VTGAAGFIGRRLVPLLRTHQATVQAWDRIEAAGVDRRLDLADGAAVRQAIESFQPRIVFHLATVGVSHERAHDPRVIGENTACLGNLMDAMEGRPGTDRPALVMTGTMAEYGPARSPIAETDPCRPSTAYAMAKYVCTRLVERYAKAKGIDAVVARLFHVYGPGEPDNRLFPTLLARLSAGEPVPLSDGRQARDFVHVDDACECLARLALTPGARGRVVNVGTGKALSVRDAAGKVASLLGADPSLLRFGSRERSPGDEDLLQADVTTLQELLSWVPPQRFLDAESIRDLQPG
jgi:nucleoside-diphosphate-sugar epimerase